MRTLKLKLTAVNSKVIPNIAVDGKFVKCKKNQYGSYDATIETEKDEIELSFTRDLELKAKLWWLYAIISFIVSIFGIFEPFYDKKCVSMNCVFKIKLNDINEVTAKFNTLSSSGKAVELETPNQFEEVKNVYEVDKTAKKRWIILLVIKIVVWIGIGILAGYFISKLF